MKADRPRLELHSPQVGPNATAKRLRLSWAPHVAGFPGTHAWLMFVPAVEPTPGVEPRAAYWLLGFGCQSEDLRRVTRAELWRRARTWRRGAKRLRLYRALLRVVRDANAILDSWPSCQSPAALWHGRRDPSGVKACERRVRAAGRRR